MVATRPPTATVSSGFSGTIQYMSPEQLDGDPGDHRADIFAFGCVLYEMLAGRKAFEGADRRHGDCRDHEHRAAADWRALRQRIRCSIT